MDVSYNLVAAKCAAQMSTFQNCVSRNQNQSWGDKCAEESQALTKCADEKVPQLKALKTTCGDSVKAYANCMMTHGHSPDDQVAEECQGVMRDLWKCTDEVMGKAG